MDRRALLADLIGLRRPQAEILGDLERTRLASGDLAVLTRSDLSEILRRVRGGELAFNDAVAWAKEVELIDDIGREEGWEEQVNSVLFELASPELDDRSEEERLKTWCGQLLGLNVEGRDGQPASKHRSIVQLLDRLAMAERGWVETDTWDGDLCAVGIARLGAPRPLVYVSVWNLPPGRYYYECETPTGPDATDYEVVERGEDVDFETLRRAMERHLKC
jgi:hypothetical protein